MHELRSLSARDTPRLCSCATAHEMSNGERSVQDMTVHLHASRSDILRLRAQTLVFIDARFVCSTNMERVRQTWLHVTKTTTRMPEAVRISPQRVTWSAPAIHFR